MKCIDELALRQGGRNNKLFSRATLRGEVSSLGVFSAGTSGFPSLVLRAPHTAVFAIGMEFSWWSLRMGLSL